MSEYIRFVLERAGCPVPKTVAVFRHDESWANRQILDEFRALFTGVDITIVDAPEPRRVDLFVIPYTDNFFVEQPGGLVFYRTLRREHESWVVLYGLVHRIIYVMPAKNLYRFYRRWRIVNFTNHVLERSRMKPFIVTLLRLIELH